MSRSLVTIECSRPSDAYTLWNAGPVLDVHLAAPSQHGTGPCICGFDRFARDENGHFSIGFSVGGGVTGPSYTHEPCPDCTRLIDGRPIHGLHANLFRGSGASS